MFESRKLTLTNELLDDIELSFSLDSHRFPAFIDLELNEVVFFSSDVDEGPEDWEPVNHENNQNRFLPLPLHYKRDKWERAENFIETLEDPKIRERLSQTIDRRAHLDNFFDEVYDTNLFDIWYEHTCRIDRKHVLEWLYSIQAISVEDIEKGMQFVEDEIALRKRREANEERMTPGATVICSNNFGHTNQITPGTTYKVLAEQKQNLLVRIIDDRGKIIWIPKSHFEFVSGAG